jgi:hypothetical protein
MELKVLRVAEKTIKKYRPIIYTEADRSDKNKELFEYIKSLGYRIYKHEPTLYSPNNYFHNPENVFVNEEMLSDGTKISVNIVSSNVLCIPSEIDAKVDGFPEIS